MGGLEKLAGEGIFAAWKAWLACELTALGTACSPDADLRAYSVRDWKGERSENTRSVVGGGSRSPGKPDGVG